jgi:hypothetical protein
MFPCLQFLSALVLDRFIVINEHEIVHIYFINNYGKKDVFIGMSTKP